MSALYVVLEYSKFPINVYGNFVEHSEMSEDSTMADFERNQATKGTQWMPWC